MEVKWLVVREVSGMVGIINNLYWLFSNLGFINGFNFGLILFMIIIIFGFKCIMIMVFSLLVVLLVLIFLVCFLLFG